jgi:hypothetical protein
LFLASSTASPAVALHLNARISIQTFQSVSRALNLIMCIEFDNPNAFDAPYLRITR